MNINNMDFEDYMKLFLFNSYMKDKNKEMYIDYRDNFHPTSQDIEDYNNKVEQFKKAWEKDKALVHKPIMLSAPKIVVDKDNDFVYCQEVGHKWELEIEKKFKEYGIDIGMYYDERQFKGENEFGIEIKHDDKIQVFKRVYIEYDALDKDEKEFIAGGITKEDNSIYWLIGNETYGYFIFYKSVLYKIYRQMVLEGKKVEGCSLRSKKTDSGKVTSHGIAIDISKAKEIMIADNILEFLIKTGKLEVENDSNTNEN